MAQTEREITWLGDLIHGRNMNQKLQRDSSPSRKRKLFDEPRVQEENRDGRLAVGVSTH
jgi:hypothetical protein